ncbi:hypothetical protein F4811DRAFT_567469 [Daldinia bambusicola]|nr:hypothetical protein F4811DRAFT_567469 [Daldinia bambusicola]
MKWLPLTTLALFAPSHALIRIPCARLVVDRLDPLVNPGLIPSPHLHQIVGGNSFNATMDPAKHMPGESTCNYWTARVPQMANSGFHGINPGMTLTECLQGFRMYIGNVNARSREEIERFRQLTYPCLQDINTRDPQTPYFPKEPCPYGIMTALRFPTCWDGKNLVSADHIAHMAYPESGTFETGGPCPASHPFNNREDWPEDGSQPFVWSFGSSETQSLTLYFLTGTGYGNHGDYVFGWKDDALQRALDQPCYINCPTLKTQNAQAMNSCSKERVVTEDNIDDWAETLPGGMVAGM